MLQMLCRHSILNCLSGGYKRTAQKTTASWKLLHRWVWIYHPKQPTDGRDQVRILRWGWRGECCTRGFSSNHVVTSPFPDADIPEIPLTEFVWKNVDKWPKRIALECGITGKRYTYEEARDATHRFGSALVKMGFKRGDVLALVSSNIPEFPIAYLGAVGVGGIVTVVNPLYTADEVVKQLRNCKAKMMVLISAFIPQMKKVREEYPDIEQTILMEGADYGADLKHLTGYVKFNDLLLDDGTAYTDDPEVNVKDDVVVLPYSSGTTGLPKGVMLTHYNLVSNICQITQGGQRFFEETTSSFQETFLGLLPFFHIYGMIVILFVGLQGGVKLVTLPKFDPETFLSTLENHKPTFLHAVPPIMGFLANHPGVKPHHFQATRGVMNAAAPLGLALIHKVEDRLKPYKPYFIEGYGLTETSPITNIGTRQVPLGSCGAPVPNTLEKVVDTSTGENLGPHQTGELYVKGPQVMKGYYNNPEATSQVIDADGWFRTGDIVYYDENKYFYIVDRVKELIKVKGLQVAPSELEDLLLKHPGIQDVAVIGVPDDRAGELPRAYIVKKRTSLTSQDVQDYINQKVAPYKRLEGGVRFVDAIPKSSTGKILRRQIK